MGGGCSERPDDGHGDGRELDDLELRAVGFDHSPHMVAVLEGPDLILRAHNDLTAGFAGPRALGRPMREAYAELVGQQVLEVFRECYETGEPRQFRGWRFELELPDGGVRETFLDFTARPWTRQDGSVRGVVVAAQDATTHVQATRAAQNAHLDAARELADTRVMVTTLQDAHLPHGLPMLPRLDVAARYLLAVEHTTAGGDWFDAVVRPNGTVALLVGDVVGHGVAASATMGQLRAVVRERLTSTATMEEVLHDVDRFAASIPPARGATLCLIELDTATGHGRYCTAGHPPPLVHDGGPRYLPPTGGAPLGTTGELPVAAVELTHEDALVVLYTDGILERPGIAHSASPMELAATVQDIVEGRSITRSGPRRLTERVCELTIEMLTRTTGYADDITVLAAQRVSPPRPLHREWTAHPNILGTARAAVSDWLAQVHARVIDRVAVQHAATELLANAADHAYADQDRPGKVRLWMELTAAGDLLLKVGDHGRWRSRPPDEPAASGGRGLAMTRTLLDRVEVQTGPAGTTVTGSVTLERPARLLAGSPTTKAQRLFDDVDFAIISSPGRLVVRGAVLGPEADRLAQAVARFSRAGTHDLVVDLSAVTHLGSAGVQALHDLLSAAPERVVLVAPNGTVAQHVLDLVQLPYRPRAQSSTSDDA